MDKDYLPPYDRAYRPDAGHNFDTQAEECPCVCGAPTQCGEGEPWPGYKNAIEDDRVPFHFSVKEIGIMMTYLPANSTNDVVRDLRDYLLGRLLDVVTK